MRNSPMRLNRLFLSLLLLSHWGGYKAVAATDLGSPLSAGDIIHRAIQRDDELRRDRQRYECDVNVRTEKLDAKGSVVSAKAVNATMRPTREIAIGGEVQAEKMDRDYCEARKFMAVLDLQKLAPRFQLTRDLDADAVGRGCYVVSYRPRPGQAYDTREEKVINSLSGRFWIAKDDFSIVQSEGALAQPVTVAFVASVYRLEFQYRSQPLPSGETAPASFQVNLAVRAPLYDMRQRQTSTISNYR
jgi:hypothetical protein